MKRELQPASKADRRTIGALAREAGVNIETVRFYERRGLLRRPANKEPGWREYDESAVWTIHYIKLAQKLGFGLAEIKRLGANIGRGRTFCDSFQKALEEKIALVDRKIMEMKAVRRQLKSSLKECLEKSAVGKCPIAERCHSQFVMPGPEPVRRRNS